MIHYVFYGFARNLFDKDLVDGSRRYAFLPSTRDEDLEERVTVDQVREKIGSDATVVTWEYDKPFFLQRVAAHPNIPRFNEHFQLHYRLLSSFYHIQRALALLDDAEVAPEDTVVLSRLDLGLLRLDLPTAQALLKDHDVVVTGFNKDIGVNDSFFALRPSAIPAFKSIFDCYLDDYPRLPSSRSEDAIGFRLRETKQRVAAATSALVHLTYHHRCTRSCACAVRRGDFE